MNKIHIAVFQNGNKPRIVPDAAMTDFQNEETLGYSLSQARAVLVDGYWYTLDVACPDNGFEEWSNSLSAEELEKEQLISSLDPLVKDKLFPDFKTRAELVAKKQADDAVAALKAFTESEIIK